MNQNAQTQFTPSKASQQRRKELRMLAFCGACGLLAASAVFYSYVRVKHSNAATAIVQTVAGTPAQEPAEPRTVKLIDASRCTRAQLKVVNDTLVSDPACTTVVYDDETK